MGRARLGEQNAPPDGRTATLLRLAPDEAFLDGRTPLSLLVVALDPCEQILATVPSLLDAQTDGEPEKLDV
jgi:hypothetical protein